MVNSLCMMLLVLAANIQKIPLKAKRMGKKGKRLPIPYKNLVFPVDHHIAGIVRLSFFVLILQMQR